MDVSIYYVCSTLSETLLNQSISERTRELRTATILQLPVIMGTYLKKVPNPGLIEQTCKKKLLSMEQRREEINTIMRPPKVYYGGNKLMSSHEELLIWSLTSLRASLTNEGFDRFIEVFRVVFPNLLHIFHLLNGGDEN